MSTNGAPRRIKLPNGEWYVLTVFRVQSTYENGTPEDITLIPDDVTCELSDDQSKNRFILCYVREQELNRND